MTKIYIWQEETVEKDDYLTISATIENPKGERRSLWYKIPSQYASAITESSDSFIIASLFRAMEQKTDVIVKGVLSPSLLRNLAEYQAIWHCWLPHKYQPIEIIAEEEQETPLAVNDEFITPFSGGVDSCFSAFTHAKNLCGRTNRNIGLAMMVHGFDIPLSEPEMFARAYAKNEEMLKSLELELFYVSTNFRSLKQDWEHSFVTGLVSCMSLLKGKYKGGLIPSGEPYQDLINPWGSHPMIDYLLSSDNFTIQHDAARFTRGEKTEVLTQWLEALQNLRVCWQGKEKDRNCGKCEKCIRTILNFKAVGADVPPCFSEDVTNAQIYQLALKKLNKPQLNQLKFVLEKAKSNNISDSWVNTLERTLIVNKFISKLLPLKSKIKKIIKR
jgi:hypothetical protein